MSSGGCAWRTSCCGIFCDSWEGSETECKIPHHISEYPVSIMCAFGGVSRSGYYGFIQCLGRPGKTAALAKIIVEQRKRSFRTYGYRRM